MEKVLAITVHFPTKITQKIRRLQRQYFEKRLVDEPHLTLYLCKFPPKNYPKLVGALRKKTLLAFDITISSVRKDNSRPEKTFYYYAIKSPRLHLLHKSILKIANPYRDSLIRTKDIKRLGEGRYSRVEASRLINYGYALVLQGFKPHISLGNSQMHSVAKRAQFEKQANSLLGVTLPITELVVGLYDYDTKRDAYLKSKKNIIKLH